MPNALAQPRAACADRLDLVDAAFGEGNGRKNRGATAELRDHYCGRCPIERACFVAGMGERRQGGVWGGTSGNQRTRAANRRPRTAA